MGLFSRRDRPGLAVTYAPHGKDGALDQTVTLRNATEAGLRPVLQFSAVDFYGRPLPHVEIGTVLGMDRGAVVVPPGCEGVDVLHFHGMGARNVRGVNVSAVDVQELDLSDATAPIEALMVDMTEHATLDPTEFWGVGVVNRNEAPVSLKVTLVELEPVGTGGKDAPRQAVDAMTLTEPVELASQSHDVVWLPEEVRGRFHAVLAHLDVPWAGPSDAPGLPGPEAV
ncbi:hypothetical protein ACHAAC_10165 [Aeromicrobium sp. CF4.19]|uniref:hypothetical protein n=1 Tax=Aeromicrobium sp. CF4.19 TaxID=3373082 RepID=UPI003EE4D6A8